MSVRVIYEYVCDHCGKIQRHEYLSHALGERTACLSAKQLPPGWHNAIIFKSSNTMQRVEADYCSNACHQLALSKDNSKRVPYRN